MAILKNTGILFQPGIIVPPIFSPLDLSPALWLDASDSTTIFNATVGGTLPADGQAIGRWEDKSGNGLHATMGSGVSQPLRKTAIQNGKDVVRFDGANDYMQTATLALPDVSTFTVFTVQKKNSSKTQPIFNNGSTNSGFGFYEYLGNRNILFNAVAFLTDGVFPNGSFELWGAKRLAGTTTFFVNAASQTITNSTATPVSPTSTTTIATENTSNFFDGDISEILIYPTALADADRQAVEAYLNSKWNIY